MTHWNYIHAEIGDTLAERAERYAVKIEPRGEREANARATKWLGINAAQVEAIRAALLPRAVDVPDDLQGSNAAPLRVVVTVPGATHGFGERVSTYGQTVVEFYDRRGEVARFGEHGQHVADYYLDTIAEIAAQGRGLMLYGGEREWIATPETIAWLAARLAAWAD